MNYLQELQDIIDESSNRVLLSRVIPIVKKYSKELDMLHSPIVFLSLKTKLNDYKITVETLFSITPTITFQKSSQNKVFCKHKYLKSFDNVINTVCEYQRQIIEIDNNSEFFVKLFRPFPANKTLYQQVSDLYSLCSGDRSKIVDHITKDLINSADISKLGIFLSSCFENLSNNKTLEKTIIDNLDPEFADFYGQNAWQDIKIFIKHFKDILDYQKDNLEIIGLLASCGCIEVDSIDFHINYEIPFNFFKLVKNKNEANVSITDAQTITIERICQKMSANQIGSKDILKGKLEGILESVNCFSEVNQLKNMY